MQAQTIQIVSQAIRYIESHLDDKLELDTVASALHYSKFYLHRIFAKTVGLTIHGYARRRRLTEAAKLLTYSKKSMIEIALVSGYESQQAFTDIFKAMYKTTPAEFREMKEFYPLQLEVHLKEGPAIMDVTKAHIQLATPVDVEDWMELVSLTVDGYPCLNREAYITKLHQYIADQRAFILRDEDGAVGAMGCSPDTGSIDFLAVHPQYRNLGVTELFLDRLVDELPCKKEISLTTYRAGDKADTGYREEYYRLGFVERELLVEYGYPTQRFVLLPKSKEEVHHDRNTEEPISEKF
ncbi:MAG: GNAT family N-acetyltransferase [Lachnospiraceae bacterium]|nr:GNAT family N-acetyltransferase [Lachnospiraceae bacterium]